MSNLPSGTVAFLFTDIEGSTPLWERDREAMRRANEHHIAILGQAITAHGGHHFKTIGDAVQAAFPTVPAALFAAVDAQRALAAEKWPETGALRVRMAIHVGEATPVGSDYLAPCLNRLSRLLNTGNGGQVLLTEAVHQLVRDSMPDGVALRDLGAHRLKDLLHPERVSQTLIPGLPNDFPDLRSLERCPTNLPIQPTLLIGRERELAMIEELLGRAETRLVTLTGSGGTGKTRLALQVAAELLDRFEDGAFFVDLSALTDPDFVLPTTATTLGVRESGEQSLRDALVAFLSGKQLLLVLDNFEHMLPAAAPVVANLLAECAGITVLVTSRAALRVRGEREVVIQPLELPPPPPPPTTPDQLSQYAAVRLFIERASDVRADFTVDNVTAPAIAEICHQLDGLPLAIELAAARVRVLPPNAILARLERRLPLLTGGARDQTARQRTLRATIAWSYDLLRPDEQRLFRRLAVFAGGFTLDAAERVSGPAGGLDLDILDGVTALIDQSLIRLVSGLEREPRYVMLETLREFGLEQLEAAGETEATREAHAAWCLAFAEEAEPELTGPDQATWFERLESEHDNMRAALSWAAAGLERAEMGLCLAARLWRYWFVRGHYSEGREWLRQSLANTDPSPSTVRAIAVNGAGTLARVQGDYVEAATLFETCLTLRTALDDQKGVAAALGNLGLVAQAQDDYGKAATLHEKSLAIKRTLGDQAGMAASFGNLGIIAHEQGDYDKAAALHEESLAIKRVLNNNPRGISISLDNLGLVAEAQGNFIRAAELYEECLSSRRLMKNPRGIALSLESSARLSSGFDDATPGTRLMAAASALRDRLGAPAMLSTQARNERFLGEAKERLGDSAFAAAWEAGRQLSMEEAVEEALTVLRLVRPHGDAGNGATPASASDVD